MDPLVWFALGGILVLGGAVWLRAERARYLAALREAGDPVADHPNTKEFRRRFQAHLFGMEGGGPGSAAGRTLVTILMVLLLGAIVVYSALEFLAGDAP